jgi:VacB/RNase II family 3'-5' exoribonuclease
MIEKGLLPDFSIQAIAQLNEVHGNVPNVEETVQDLRSVLWCSIDNDDSNDLDQLTAAIKMPGGAVKILIAIADVDAFVEKSSALDDHAKHNTTSVYTAAQIFPMLPEKLSNDITSLNYEADRLAIVVEIIMAGDGSLESSEIYRAIVRNRAKLAYNGVAAWLEGSGPMPNAIGAVSGLAENLRLQNGVAQKLKALRHMHGALEFETIEARPIFEADEIKDLEAEQRNSAKDIIEDFMIAANGVTARYLTSKMFPSLRRVVRTPKRWERIVELALQHNFVLPKAPDSRALDQFLVSAKAADPLRFPDLSLSVIKLLGSGEYVVEFPGGSSAGHFGLAVKDYAHSTAPNRRYPDLITQRLLKAAISGSPIPYGNDELEFLAKHCTEAENAAQKVERQVAKSAAAILLESRIGETFDAIITGSSDKGTWVRLLHPPVEGRLSGSFNGEDVGHRLRVQLVHTDVERGYIDFKKI